ncbi:MAG: hypothetical protein RIT03_384 [Bacteroidota bacterium]
MSGIRYRKGMCKLVWLWFVLGIGVGAQAQVLETPYKAKMLEPTYDTIRIDSVSINASFFKVLTKNGEPIDPASYEINFPESYLVFKKNYPLVTDSIRIRYLKFPEHLTKKYSIYDDARVLTTNIRQPKLFSLSPVTTNRFVPFDGLNTSGSITRGITVGNNQNSVVNSNLDLQISGKISDKVSLRASIQDNNIPLQSGGYSQKLDEFDQVFMEMYSDRWAIRAGDLFLENKESRFLTFNKKVQGLSSRFNFGTEETTQTSVFAAAALVKGQYAKSSFTGKEGNQGPYKLKGPNGELYVLVISGSERVYVNGILLERGENKDYTIDYNAGELLFTPIFPITSDMRIAVEYQYSERSYNRFVTYAGGRVGQEKWNISTAIYAESDLKNQPLQQTLTEEQLAILQTAGDDTDAMYASSAYIDSYAASKVLYKKTTVNGVTYFVYSNNPDDILYNVRFTLLGPNQGDYVLANASVVGKLFEYVAPINGVKQGNYDPVIKLVPPTKIQVATISGGINPNEKTTFDWELALSQNDANLFSTQNDNNKGLAGKWNIKQRLISKKWQLNASSSFQYVQENFKTVERLNNIEFARDWNLVVFTGNQSIFSAKLDAQFPKKGTLAYQYENLGLTNNFTGNRHQLSGAFQLKNWNLQQQGSVMKSNSSLAATTFIREQFTSKWQRNKNWIGSSLRLEDNQEQRISTRLLTPLSQRFTEWGAFMGRGDSTKVYAQIGYLQRQTDSIQNGLLQAVSRSHSYYLKSKILQSEERDLAVFINYRRLEFNDPAKKNQPSLNSRLIYNDNFGDKLVQTTTAYETASGAIAQQEFTYIEVPPGQGVYAWIDYNGNGIQELEEFEVAPFPDQAKFVRVYLPSQVFLQTHQNKFAESVSWNPIIWRSTSGFKRVLSYLYNQTAFSIDRKLERNGDQFNLNPFSSAGANLLGLQQNFRNSFFINRGKQNHSITYTFLESKVQNLLSFGSQSSQNTAHQLQYNHLIAKTWLLGFTAKTANSSLSVSDYIARNYTIDSYFVSPKLSYIFSQNASLDVFVEQQNKENKLGDLEQLNQTRIGSSFSYAGEKKVTLTGEYSYYNNSFVGNAFTPAAFQMLEGLQPGQNSTWRLLAQKNLTQYLELNLNYQGRKSENSPVVHIGSVQLRAYF